jgi:photosystem II stability/assembly factor-like uncharacterized protein
MGSPLGQRAGPVPTSGVPSGMRIRLLAAVLVLAAVHAPAQKPAGVQPPPPNWEQDSPAVKELSEQEARRDYYEARRGTPPARPGASWRRSAWLDAMEVPYWTDPNGVTPSWECIGPLNITSGWGGYDDSGRISAIAVDPRDSQRVYIGASHGGVWLSEDGCKTWKPLSDFEASLSYGALILDPFDPDIIYGGTGEAHSSGDSYFGAGLLRSTDRGKTWELFGQPEFAGAYFGQLVASPNVKGLLIGATSHGLFRSLDRGRTWTKLLDGYFRDVVNSPRQPDVFYTCGGPGNAVAVYKSSDSGNTWELLGGGLPPPGPYGRSQLAICRDHPETVYVSHIINGRTALYRTDDSGRTWRHLVNAYNYASWYNQFLACAPDNPDIIYEGGTTCHRSVDGGETWVDIARTYQWGAHPDWHGYTFDPNDPRVLYAGTDGGLFISYDRGDTWIARNDGLATVQFTGIGVHPWDPYIAIGGTQDNGTLRYRHDKRWKQVFYGDGGTSIINPVNPDRMYTEYITLQMYRSDNGGDDWGWIAGGIDRTGALFYAPFEMDPNNPDVLVAGASRVWRTTDGGDTWTAISGNMGSVSALAVAPHNSEVVYAGSRDGRIWVTPNCGKDWYEITKGAAGDRGGRGRYGAFVSAIAVDPRSPRRVIVAFGGYGHKHLYRSENAGGTWTVIDDNLPDAPATHVVIDPTRPDDVYVSLDVGVFVSNSWGGHWRRYGIGLPHSPVERLDLNRRTGYLSTATHGRSAWRVPLPDYKAAPSR